MGASPRAANRIAALGAAALRTLFARRAGRRPRQPEKLLVLHELLLGDTLMLAPLLAALRTRYPQAALYVSANPAYAPLFAGRPYGAIALPYSERAAGALANLEPARGADIALLPGENRYAVTARALGARWVVGLAGGAGGWRDRLLDERVPLPRAPRNLSEIFASLAGLEATPAYRASDWPAPPCTVFERPAQPYSVLHVGASTPLKCWPAASWRALAERLAAQGHCIVWSAGPGEEQLVQAIDPEGRHRSLAGRLDTAQLWHLVAGASLLVSVDTGIAHLAKLTGTRTLCLYGPGSAALVGRGAFWRDAPFEEITVPDFPCRDQRILFRREICWVRRCGRGPRECPRPRCMEAIGVEGVLQVVRQATGAEEHSRSGTLHGP